MGRSQMAALTMEEMVVDQNSASARATTRTSSSRSARWVMAAVGLLLVEALVAAAVRAQPAAPARPSAATHTVQAGETLWSLAQRYLGNPRRWKDVAEANGLPMDAQRRLPVGKSLLLPGALRTADGSASAELPEAVPTAPVPAGAPATMPAADVSRDDGRSGLFMRSARRYEIGVRVDRDPDSMYIDGAAVHATPKPRLGEALAAPFVIAPPDLAAAPALGARLAMSAPASEFSPLVRIRDRVVLVLPKGASAQVGQRFVSVRDEAEWQGGRLVEPTGLLVVEQEGKALVGRVIELFGRVEEGQRLVAANVQVPAFADKAMPVAGSRPPAAAVRYVDGNPLLPTLQRYLVIGGAASSWKVGDEVELRTPDPKPAPKGWRARVMSMGAEAPAPAVRANELVGRARVIRVNRFGATAVVIHHDQPSIGEGTVATVVARIP
jgi:LysM repeat protein